MAQLDTHTVLEIIKMIDYRTAVTNKALRLRIMKDEKQYFSGKIDAYEELAHHLQEYIEGQLNVAENNTGE